MLLKAGKQETIESIRQSGLPVIIYGADVVGEVMYRACEDAGITVTAFCDNNKNKTHAPFCGLPIHYTPELPKIHEDAIFLLASTYIQDAIAQLKLLKYSRWHGSALLLQDIDLFKREYSRPAHFVEFSVNACLLSHNGYMDPGRLYLRCVDLIITERCSMKCKDCANLMQYYASPENVKLAELQRTITSLCAVVDEVYEVRVIGGEPFMNPECHLVVARLNEEPKVKRVVVYTNGTILPKEEQLAPFLNSKVIFIITDYGALSRNLKGMTERFQQNGIHFVVQKAAGWTDSGQIYEHHRTEPELQQTFQYCCVKNYTSISDGKLYRCPFSANAARLRATPEFKEDYFDLFALDQDGSGLAEAKQRLRAFLMDKPFLRACDFCNGRTYGSPEIEPAVQAKAKLEYKRYGS